MPILVVVIAIIVVRKTMVTMTLFRTVMGIIKEGSNEMDLLINGE